MNDNLKINKETTCAFTGHRTLYEDFNIERLKKVVVRLLEIGYDTFLVGMAVGFDMVCFKVLEQFRKTNNLKIIACVPCKGQDAKFSINQKKEYKRMLSVADEVITLEETYTPYCMIKRNRFMVDNCSFLVSYLRKNSGGTKYTVDYAKKQNIPVYNV